jgi:hypothetical protein
MKIFKISHWEDKNWGFQNILPVGPVQVPWRHVHPSTFCPIDISSHATIYYCDILTQNGPQKVDGLSHANVSTTAAIRNSNNTSFRQFIHLRFHAISTVPSHFLNINIAHRLECCVPKPNLTLGMVSHTEQKSTNPGIILLWNPTIPNPGYGQSDWTDSSPPNPWVSVLCVLT